MSDTKTPHESTQQGRNRLAGEKSPYLLQHANNPVDWYPWGDEAFEKARREDKPIFLSIGYSTCHWCHVMEHESFEDADVAKLMNDTFVSIKVDREERPDIDNIYMTVCQMMTGSGGWPLTIIMTPDRKPFFAATYIPKHSRFGRSGMMELIPQIAQVWHADRRKIDDIGEKITSALQQETGESSGAKLTARVLNESYDEFSGRFDRHLGGFGSSPKFPTPHNLSFLLRHWRRTGTDHSLAMVEKTLKAMRSGGIYDHVGYGFHRYSTDREWLLPHFEKMLYDQAMLAIAYLEACQATGDELYADTAGEIFAYVLRDMTSPEGAFYSAEDADSEGEEGKFYVWTIAELRDVLGPDDASFAAKILGATKDGNFSEEAGGHKTGANILHLHEPTSELAADLGMNESAFRARLESVRRRLFEVREKRIHPLKDDKILTDWNGLMIAALSIGARTLHEPAYAAAAAKAADFILTQLRDDEGRLLHRYREGEAAIRANLDDYAFMVWGLTELYETSFDPAHLRIALDLNETMLQRFSAADGSLYFTADDADEVLARRKEVYDGAVPSGNSVAALNLLRLGRLTGNSELEERAERLMQAFSGSVTSMPSAHSQMLIALDFALGPVQEIVIAGDLHAQDTQAMLRAINGEFRPRKVVLVRSDQFGELGELAPYTVSMRPADGKATAYVCGNFECQAPTTNVSEMLDLLKAR